MNKTFVLATANPGKIHEMRTIMTELGIDSISREDAGIDIIVEETGSTFMENALLKAEAICKISGMPAIADDSGLMVDALGGAPGVFSSTYGGERLDATARYTYLLEKMGKMEQRAAKFVCIIVCAFPDGSIISAQGECLGEIALSPRGAGGFGYDPVFIVEGTGKTMAELLPDEKNALSHRGKALEAFAKQLRNLNAESGILKVW